MSKDRFHLFHNDQFRGPIYIAGPMTGYKDYNYPAFYEAAAYLRGKGYTVINPAEYYGGKANRTQVEYLRRSFLDIVQLHHNPNAGVGSLGAVVVLPRWTKSAGAKAEVHIAQLLDIPVYTYSLIRTLGLNKNSRLWGKVETKYVVSAEPEYIHPEHPVAKARYNKARNEEFRKNLDYVTQKNKPLLERLATHDIRDVTFVDNGSPSGVVVAGVNRDDWEDVDHVPAGVEHVHWGSAELNKQRHFPTVYPMGTRHTHKYAHGDFRKRQSTEIFLVRKTTPAEKTVQDYISEGWYVAPPNVDIAPGVEHVHLGSRVVFHLTRHAARDYPFSGNEYGVPHAHTEVTHFRKIGLNGEIILLRGMKKPDPSAEEPKLKGLLNEEDVKRIATFFADLVQQRSN